ncbi:MAG: class I mannose-6-phosphate isomerase, partial [Phycisphaerales bacterium JB038]
GADHLDDGAGPHVRRELVARQGLLHPLVDHRPRHPEAHLKSEAWYILEAEPGAVIYKGVKEPLTRDEFAAHVRAGTVVEVLRAVEARPGTCHYLPAGTCHALGEGVLVAEVQTPSDTTFRVYDWGRTDREIHIEQALECVDLQPTDTRREEKRSHLAAAFSSVSKLLQTDHFQVERIRMSEGYAQEIPYSDPAVWLVLEGAGTIDLPEGPGVDFAGGETLLIPANMTEARLSLAADTMWLEVQFPQIQAGRIAGEKPNDE